MEAKTQKSASLTLACASGLGPGFAIAFAALCLTHQVLFYKAGHIEPIDFAQFWTAGKLALKGNIFAVYDPRLLHAAEVIIAGHPFEYVSGWLYPPIFLFVAVTLASMPPMLGFLLWTNGTLLLQSMAVATIARSRWALLVAMAPPWTIMCMMLGQDGLLTAAIIGFVLISLERRATLAGLLLAVLTYKPQFGLLFPVALAFGGYWRTFISAGIGVVCLTLLSWSVFGLPAWLMFFHAIHGTMGAMKSWPGILSLFGAVRRFGDSYETAVILQTALGALCAAVVALMWRSRIPNDLKAACLVTCIPMVTPYVWDYDLPILSIALAYLYRHRRFDWADMVGLTLACVAVAAIPFFYSAFPRGNLPAGLIATASIGVLLVRRLIVTPQFAPVLSRLQCAIAGTSFFRRHA